MDGYGMGGLKQRKKVGGGGCFGNIVYSESPFGSNNAFGGIFRKRLVGWNQYEASKKNRRRAIYERLQYYRPTNPRTAKQQANRTAFAEAMRAWQELPEDDKQYYRNLANGRPILGHNLFIKEFLEYAKNTTN